MLCHLRERVQLTNARAEHVDVGGRPPHVGDVEREHPRAHRPAFDERMGPEPVEHVGVVIELATRRLAVDRQRSLGDVGLGDGEIDEEIRIAVADIGRLVGLVQAHRDLHPDPARRPEAAPEPGADPAGDHRQHDIVEGDRAVDRLSRGAGRRQRHRRERDRAPSGHAAGERGSDRRARELAADHTAAQRRATRPR